MSVVRIKCFCDKGMIWKPNKVTDPDLGGDWIKCTEPGCINGYVVYEDNEEDMFDDYISNDYDDFNW